MLVPSTILQLVIIPVIDKLGIDMGDMKPVAHALLLGTALTESNLNAIKQVHGPAQGLWQMEPFTEDDLLYNFIKAHTSLKVAISVLRSIWPEQQLPGNMYYAAAMCRIKYYSVPEPLPSLSLDTLANYWKLHYNTLKGAGTPDDFKRHSGDVLKELLGVPA